MTSKELKNKPLVFGAFMTSSVGCSNPDINDVFCLISCTSSKLKKEEFLKERMNPTIEQILQDTYGGRKYFVKQYEFDENFPGTLTLDSNYNAFRILLNKLAGRDITGNAAKTAVAECIEQFRPCDRIWLARILDGNLKIGAGQTFSEDSGTVDKYPCALANVLEKTKNVNVLDGSWLASRKLDGCRCHAHVDMDARTVDFKSRQGKTFTTLDNLKQPVLDFLTNEELGLTGKWVLDGEVCIMHGDEEDFQGLMSVIRRKDFTIDNPRYKVFDILTEDEFYGRAESPNFSARYDMLTFLFAGFNNPAIDVIVQERLITDEDLNRWQEYRRLNGWEGIMVRKDVPYEGKRTNNLLKIKPFQDAEYVVTGIIEGDLTYNTPTGSETIHGVSALTIEHKGNVVKVGSGMTKEQRLAWVADPELIIGKTITVQYFEETQDKKTGEYSLRFPVLKVVYESERDI